MLKAVETISSKKKKSIYLIGVVLIFIIIFGFVYKKSFSGSNTVQSTDISASEDNEQVQVENYDKQISDLVKTEKLIIINNEDVSLLETNDVLLYFGRNDCPSCQGFIQTLTPILNYIDSKVYYFDTNDKENENCDYLIKKYEISKVPTLLRINNSNNTKDIFEPEIEGLATFIKDSKGE